MPTFQYKTKNRLTEQEKIEMINNINASFSIEKMPLTAEDKNRMKRYLDGKITIDQAIAEITHAVTNDCED